MEEQNSKELENKENETEKDTEAVAKEKKPLPKRAIIIGAAAALAAIVAVVLIILFGTNESRYNRAISLLEKEKYEEAYRLFRGLGDYEDAAEYMERFHYVLTEKSVGADSKATASLNGENLPKTYVDLDGAIWSFFYDEKGNLGEKTVLHSNGDELVIKYTYDDGELIKEVCRDNYGDTSVWAYVYDDGKNVKTTHTHSGGGEDVYDYVYADGRLIKEVATYHNGDVFVYEYTYNEGGALIKELCSHSDGDEDVFEYAYDSLGNLIGETRTYFDGSEVVLEYTYDKNGRLMKESCSSLDGDGYVLDHTYDDDGNLIRTVETELGSVVSVTECKYKLVYVTYELSDTVLEMLKGEYR